MMLYWGTPLGYQQITADTSAGSLTVPDGASIAVMGVDAANIRWRDDGTDPTSAIGILMRSTDLPLVYSGNLAKFRLIEVSGTPLVNVSYYGTKV
jgi:hypothetical protein